MTSRERISTIRKAMNDIALNANAVAGDKTLPEDVRIICGIICEKATHAEGLVRAVANEEGIPLTEGSANA